MRIIAGTARGRPISAPPSGTRPTSDRVRESLFGILEARIDLEGLSVLDLYAGSGALGLEALSRGAATVVSVESDVKAAATIASNRETAGFDAARLHIRRRPVTAVLCGRASGAFDLVFCDPPYDLDGAVITDHLVALAAGDWVHSETMIAVERSARSAATVWPDAFAEVLSRTYGETRIDIAVAVDR
ncbi:16S rRNA (guanine(966)-N(2))-methyltransferase RsmD [Williamsia sp. CHRR-6]|uniref:16S rRNA (guanine(966)-N(2))-methyltransferase RsmD n=1 Tax=Williamsia sp. CHRR-6 TaxID=2835871 RepID=UPI001BDA1DDD|nr:16S rRNA (guanine(966)-N(2))-methyltransferase RsmD [Williamsia sp. CHRR-6]MBT0568332.1 16S rRNA (guanine(966)-N(2))-methyltransferase RsmD [Williamsia sp. CHRR-6]